ncbi:hypothetical protein YC2023_065896 [Brassica napus]
MAGVSVREMTSKFRKLDKFEGVDFRRWQKKMHFFLTNLNVVYVLSMPMPTVPEDAENESLDETRKQLKWENDDYICRGHILNAMEQYNELLRILGQFAQHNMKIDESISVSSIIDNHLRIEESLKAQEGEKPKNNEASTSSINMMEEEGRIKIKRDKTVWEKCLRTKVHPLIKDDEVARWIDSGATTHVCKDSEWFTTYEQLPDGSVLHMGNESTAPILCRGKVVLEFSSGKILDLNDVLHETRSVDPFMGTPENFCFFFEGVAVLTAKLGW